MFYCFAYRCAAMVFGLACLQRVSGLAIVSCCRANSLAAAVAVSSSLLERRSMSKHAANALQVDLDVSCTTVTARYGGRTVSVPTAHKSLLRARKLTNLSTHRCISALHGGGVGNGATCQSEIEFARNHTASQGASKKFARKPAPPQQRETGLPEIGWRSPHGVDGRGICDR
jgi:hypothetical protein